MNTICAQAARGNGTATGNTQQLRGYHKWQALSRANPDLETQTALGSLLVYLAGRELPDQERRLGWSLVEQWTVELVEAKRGQLVGGGA